MLSMKTDKLTISELAKATGYKPNTLQTYLSTKGFDHIRQLIQEKKGLSISMTRDQQERPRFSIDHISGKRRETKGKVMDIEFEDIPFNHPFDTIEFAEMMGVSEQTIRDWAEKGLDYFQAKSIEYTGVSFSFIKGNTPRSQIYIFRTKQGFEAPYDTGQYDDDDDDFDMSFNIDEIEKMPMVGGRPMQDAKASELERQISRLADLVGQQQQQINRIGGGGTGVGTVALLSAILPPLLEHGPKLLEYFQNRPSAYDMLLDGIELAERLSPKQESQTSNKMELLLPILMKAIENEGNKKGGNRPQSEPIPKTPVKGIEPAMVNAKGEGDKKDSFDPQY